MSNEETNKPLQSGGSALNDGLCPGNISLRDYAAIHSTQPGCSEICAMAGLTWSVGKVWASPDKSIGTFDQWWESIPLDERLVLCARVRYAQADAMLRIRDA